jgi:hypothetical protein
MIAQVFRPSTDKELSSSDSGSCTMTEHQRLQKMRDLGFRLQELQLIRVEAGASFAGAALTYLFNLYQVQKPAGMPLEQTLSMLARVVQQRHQLPYLRLTADAVLEFFSQRFAVMQKERIHPTYRLSANVSRVASQMA